MSKWIFVLLAAASFATSCVLYGLGCSDVTVFVSNLAVGGVLGFFL